MKIEVLPLHDHPKYLMDCCKIINDEWKRSDSARLHSLKNSCKELPTSLILLLEGNLIGHLKLSIIPSMKNACFVESVVIIKNLRGKGYGSILMKEAEDYCRNILKLDRIYLSTKGQEQFYYKLGYTGCMPLSIYGNYVPKLMADNKQNGDMTKNDGTIKGEIPPSPPLPPSVVSPNKQIKTFLKKDLRILS